LSGSSNPPSDDRAVKAVTRAQEATTDITSYRFTVDGQIQFRENSRTESIAITGNGVVNVEHRRANETISTRGDTRMGFREPRMAYVDGYTLDVECSRLGWARYNLTESTRWFNYTPTRATAHASGPNERLLERDRDPRWGRDGGRDCPSHGTTARSEPEPSDEERSDSRGRELSERDDTRLDQHRDRSNTQSPARNPRSRRRIDRSRHPDVSLRRLQRLNQHHPTLIRGVRKRVGEWLSRRVTPSRVSPIHSRRNPPSEHPIEGFCGDDSAALYTVRRYPTNFKSSRAVLLDT
jgi:hypothetical protein